MNRKALALGTIILTVLMGGNLIGATFIDKRPWLKERSAWSETIGAEGWLRGWWGVGNSRVFGIVGSSNPITTVHQITGPHIQHPGGVMANGTAFPASTLKLIVGGKPVAFTKQTLSKVRQTDIVVMDLVADGVEMSVYNYSPFNTNALLRTVAIRNTGSSPLNDVVVESGMPRTVVKDGMLFDSVKGATRESAIGHTRQVFAGFLEAYEAASNDKKEGLLRAEIGNIAPGAEAIRTKFMVFSMQEVGDEAKTLELVRREGTKLLKKTYDDWKSWYSTKTQLKCPDQRLIDLLDDNKILVKIQTAEPQYAAGPMEFFAGVWVRDSNGPFLYHLRMGNLEAARGMLEFYYRASAYNKRISNHKPMDIDVSKPVDPDLDWTTVHNDPVEITCWLILQHANYYRYTGDIEPIRRHWEYLKRCLYGQLVDEKGEPFHTVNYLWRKPGPNTMYRFPHHGDETWIYPGFEVMNTDVFPEPCDHPHWHDYSADSTWEFVVSAEVMADLARKLGETDEAKKLEQIAKDSRAALERDYWMPDKGFYAPAMNMHSLDSHQPPFAMVNFNALWIGYLDPEDPKAISNVVETMSYTMNPNYVTDVTETLRVYVGMQPGMFLYNLAAIDHPYGEPALKALMEVASPSGEYTEKHVTDPNSYRSEFRGHRIRPWEGGINMDAVFYYLTGLKPDMGNGRIALCPRLPFGWKEMSVTGQRLGDGLLDLTVTDNNGSRTCKIKWTGSKPITAGFKISLPKSKISSVKIDGKTAKVSPKDRWGLTTAKLDVPLAPGKETDVTVVYEKGPAETVAFERKKYEYIIPKNVPQSQIVFWEFEPHSRTGAPATHDLLEGKVKFRLINCTNPSSSEWLRPFLVKPDGKLNTSVFLMGPNSVKNSLKYKKWWGSPEQNALFTEFMKAGGAIVAVMTGETTSDFFGELLGDSSYFTMQVKAQNVVPAGDAGTKALELLGFADDEKKLKVNIVHIYKNMVVLARPEKESAAGAIIVQKVGDGFFMTVLANVRYGEELAALAQNLADPKKMKELKSLIAESKPETVKGAFEDFGKNGAFSDDFTSYNDGSTGLPVWLSLRGNWQMSGGEFHQSLTHLYDCVATANAKVSGDYEIEAKAKSIDKIFEPGFTFNMPSRLSHASSQMVRFSSHQRLWCGPFNAGRGFSLEHLIETGLNKPEDHDWHTLKVTVRNSKGTYDIVLDGKKIREGLKLTHVLGEGQSGYVGLVSCRGHIAYDSVRITPLK